MIKSYINKVIAILVGHFTVFKHSFKKPVTVKFPEQKINIPERFRGLHSWDSQLCCGCHLCEKVCPAGAIKITDDNGEKSLTIDLGKCIFCGNCMYYCPKSAIKMSDKFTLATDNKSDLTFEINTLNLTNNDNIMD